MAELTITINNLPQIEAAFRKAPALMRSQLNIAIRKTILNLQRGEVEEYKSLGIGIITRGLIGSIERGLFFGDLKGEVGPNVTGSPGVPYAIYVHDGTRYMRDRPFLGNAIHDKNKDTQQYFKDAVDNVLNNIARSA